MNKKILSVIYLLIMLCVCSCSKDDKESTEDTSNLVTLDIPILRINDVPGELTTTRNNAAQDTVTVIQELEDGLVLESTLTCDTASRTTATRAVEATPVDPNVKIVMIAYRSNGSLYKSETFTPVNPKVHLPAGEKFKLVFYSYNNDTEPELSTTGVASSYAYGDILAGYALNDSPVSHKQNAMWTKIEETPVISSSTVLDPIIFTHLFSQVQWTINSVVGEVTGCSATMTPTYEKATMKVGNLKNCTIGARGTEAWDGQGTSNYETELKWNSFGGATVTSDFTTFCPDEDKSSIVINVNNITIFGNTFNNTPISFGKLLKRGVRYKVVSTIKRKCTISFISENETIGTVSPSGSQTVTEWGQTLSSTPSAPLSSDYYFDGWYSSKDGYTNKLVNTADKYTIDSSNKLTVTVNKDTEGYIYAARYKPKSYTITFRSNDTSKGTVTNDGPQTQEFNTSIRVKATVTSNSYVLDGWYRIDKLGNETWVTVRPNVTVTFNSENDGCIYEARFQDNIQYKITFGTTGTGSGTITNEGTHSMQSGTKSSTATPDADSRFDGWVDEAGTLIESSTTITETYGPIDKVRYAKFTKIAYNLTVNTNPAGIATSTISPLKTGYESGDVVTVSVPDRVSYNNMSYKFLDWSVSPSSLSVGAGHEITITMPSSDVTLTANYLKEGDTWITTFKGWALGDLVLTSDNKLAIGVASQEGPAFKFGSLIGVDIQTGNIIFKPTEYTGGATHAQNAPYITTTKSSENVNSNDIAGMTNASQGIGDICLYASQKWPENFDHKLWRMPSNTEFKSDLGGGTYAGNPAVYTFKDATGGSMQMYCWGYWYGINNSVMWRGTYGPRWTATMTTKTGNFGSGSPAAYVVALGSGVYPDYPWGRNSAFNVRCVLFDK